MDNGTILVGINNFIDYVDMHLKTIELYPGYTYSVVASPIITAISQKAISYPFKVRACRTIQERLDSQNIFLPYSETTCALECNIKHAKESLGCVPWDMMLLAGDISSTRYYYFTILHFWTLYALPFGHVSVQGGLELGKNLCLWLT